MFALNGLSPTSNDEVRAKETNNSKDEECKLTLQDVICPICYLIMIEPVVMPCKHMLCMPCFQETVAKTAFACPFCKKRISTWLRNATRKNKLVHADLWDWIKENYSDKVQRRIDGLDDYEDECQQLTPLTISSPGEIKEEFTSQLKQLEEEERSRREKEEMQSLMLISKMQIEEEEEKMKLKKLQGELSPCAPCSALSQKSASRFPLKRKGLLKRTQSAFFPLASSTPRQLSLDIFLSRSSTDPTMSKFSKRKCLQDITASCSSDSDDSQETQGVPSRAEGPFAFLNKDKENDAASNLGSLKQMEQSTSGLSQDLGDECREDHVSYPVAESFSSANQKGERSSLCPVGEQTQACVAALSDGTMDQEFLNQLIEEQRQLEARLKQEKEDELLAMQIQREMRKVNRRKGSKDEYCLRKRISDYLLPSSSKSLPLKRSRERDKSPVGRFHKSQRL